MMFDFCEIKLRLALQATHLKDLSTLVEVTKRRVELPRPTSIVIR